MLPPTRPENPVSRRAKSINCPYRPENQPTIRVFCLSCDKKNLEGYSLLTPSGSAGSARRLRSGPPVRAASARALQVLVVGLSRRCTVSAEPNSRVCVVCACVRVLCSQDVLNVIGMLISKSMSVWSESWIKFPVCLERKRIKKKSCCLFGLHLSVMFLFPSSLAFLSLVFFL